MSVDCRFSDLIFSILTFFIIIFKAKWPDFVRGVEGELLFRSAPWPRAGYGPGKEPRKFLCIPKQLPVGLTKRG